ALGHRVNGLQDPRLLRCRGNNINFRMSDAEMASKACWFPKDDVLHARLDSLGDPVDSLKPDQFDLARFILKMANQSLFRPSTHDFLSHDVPAQLNTRHFLVYFLDG